MYLFFKLICDLNSSDFYGIRRALDIYVELSDSSFLLYDSNSPKMILCDLFVLHIHSGKSTLYYLLNVNKMSTSITAAELRTNSKKPTSNSFICKFLIKCFI